MTPEGYRPNVGVVVFNKDRRVWLGQRSGTPGPCNWQFPQGGVDPGEDVLDAARRELQEETGITSVDLLDRTEGWITYDFPPEVLHSKRARGYKGQAQVWFAFRFTGEESEIDLGGHHEVEFDAWRWARLEEAVDEVAPFKREAYMKVVEAFRPLAEGLPSK